MLNRARVPWRDRVKEEGRGKGWIEGQCLGEGPTPSSLGGVTEQRGMDGWMVLEGNYEQYDAVLTNFFHHPFVKFWFFYYEIK